MGLLKSLSNFLGVMSPVQITWFNMMTRSEMLGVDVLGNKYYEGKPRKGATHSRRWVMYKGTPEATKVPPEWHGWLHHQTDEFPVSMAGRQGYRRNWQKPHATNKTGTEEAYMPPGHQLKGGVRDKASGDYEAWTPPK